MGLSEKQRIKVRKFGVIGFIGIGVIILLILNYLIAFAFASFFTAQAHNKELLNFQNIENVNSLLINTEIFENMLDKEIMGLNFLPVIVLILIFPFGFLFYILRKMINQYNEIIEPLIPKWNIANHSKVMIPAAIGIFIAIALSYFSSLISILLQQRATIINILASQLDSTQPEVLNQLLTSYLENNFSEYFTTMFGYLYFIFALIFPISASIWYFYLKGKQKPLNVWIIMLFTATAFTIPYWIIIAK